MIRLVDYVVERDVNGFLLMALTAFPLMVRWLYGLRVSKNSLTDCGMDWLWEGWLRTWVLFLC